MLQSNKITSRRGERRKSAKITAIAIGIFIATTIISVTKNKNAHAASLDLCNYSSYVLETAVSIQKIDNFLTIGWYNVLPSRCKKIEQKNDLLIEIDSLYASFKEQDYYGGHTMDADEIKYFCVQDGRFVIQTALFCTEPYQYYSGFREIFFSEKQKKFTATVYENQKYDEKQANVAGLQRLLAVAEIADIEINGQRTKELDLILQRFARQNNVLINLSEIYSTRNAQLYKKLIGVAKRQQNNKGLFVCNNTNLQVWGAFGTENEQNITIKGWRQIASKSCIRVIKEPLVAKRILYYAEAQKLSNSSENQQPELQWGGNIQLCIDDKSFVIDNHEDCNKKGLKTKGFASINVKQQFWTIHFGNPDNSNQKK